MENKYAQSEKERDSSQLMQMNKTIEKQQQKCVIQNSEKGNDISDLNHRQNNHIPKELKNSQSSSSDINIKQENIENNIDSKMNLEKEKQCNATSETQKSSSDHDKKQDENKKENILKKFDPKQVQSDQQQNQPKQKTQFRSIQLQKVHNKNLQQQANKTQQSKQQIEHQQRMKQQKIKQLQDSLLNQNQKNQKQPSSNQVQNNQQSNHQSKQITDSQQQKQPQQMDKLGNEEQNGARVQSPPHSPHSIITQNLTQKPRKTSSFNSKERPLLLKNTKLQNAQTKEITDQNKQKMEKDKNDLHKKKEKESDTEYSLKNNKSSKPSRRINLQFSSPTSVIYYIECLQPPKILGKVIAFINDTQSNFGKREEATDFNSCIADKIQNELIGRPPIPTFLDTADSATEEDIQETEEEDDASNNYQNNDNDLTHYYWPKRCESRRTFEEENHFNDSMRVASIRPFTDISPIRTPTNNDLLSSIPKQLADLEKKYMITPPSPLSPYHAFNPRKKNHHQLNKIQNHADILVTDDENLQLKRIVTPKRSSLLNDSYSQPEIKFLKNEIANEEEEYYSDYDSFSEPESESESEIDTENEKEKENQIEIQIDDPIKNSNESEDKLDSQKQNENIAQNEDKDIDSDKDNEENCESKSTENIFMNTNYQFIAELRNYEKLISKMDDDDVFGIVQFIDNELKGFNHMTSIKGPAYEEEMTVVRFKSMKCEIIELIHPVAFEEFRFGSCVYYNDDISPDELHINAWHSLGIDPDQISISLDRFVKNNILGKNDICNIYGVLRYILKWIQLYPDDFFINPDCAVHTCKVLNRIIDKRMEVSSRSNVLKALIRAISQRKKDYTAIQRPLAAVQFKDSHKYQKISIYEKIFKFEKDIDFLVQHFSYIDLCLIHKILRSEVVRLNFLKEDKKITAPHIQDITTRFNIIARFVSYSILSVVRNHSSKLEKKCKSRIEFWILVMKKAREIRNFNLLYEIDAGLSHPSVTRLTNVWKTISKSLREDFNRLHDITKPVSEKMKEYINLVLENPEKTVPYLGTFFSRIVYSCEYYHKKDKIEVPQKKLNENSKTENEKCETTFFNMVYQYFLFKESSKIFLNWGVDYKFKLDRNFLQVCKDISFTCDNERLIEFSVQIQPKK